MKPFRDPRRRRALIIFSIVAGVLGLTLIAIGLLMPAEDEGARSPSPDSTAVSHEAPRP